MTKYVILIGDGMSDYPLKELGGKTPLEAAKTPNMDFIARNGIVGWVNNCPKNLPPGSDVASMSIFGYDPNKYYKGRGPLEAASLGVKLGKLDVAFRCNLVTLKNKKMESFTAHHIATKEAAKVIKVLNKKLGTKNIRFEPGLSYRHLLVVRAKNKKQKIALEKIKATPPHDITDQKFGKCLPKGKESKMILDLMFKSQLILNSMKTKATSVWLWGQGGLPAMPRIKMKGAIITAVHLLKGIGRIAGFKVINVPGATGYLDTNYLGKAKAALRFLKKGQIVIVHVEAPDEAGHEGNIKHKIKAIQDFDKYVVGPVLSKLCTLHSAFRILVLPDHPTPIRLMTHTHDAVPFAIYGSGLRATSYGVRGYNEKEIRKSKLKIKAGHKLLPLLLLAR